MQETTRFWRSEVALLRVGQRSSILSTVMMLGAFIVASLKICLIVFSACPGALESFKCYGEIFHTHYLFASRV